MNLIPVFKSGDARRFETKSEWADRQGRYNFRLEHRKITAEDLYKLKLWRESDPEAPEKRSDPTEAASCSQNPAIPGLLASFHFQLLRPVVPAYPACYREP